MKSKVKWMTEQLVIRLNKDFQVPAGLTLSPPADELDGPSSIVNILEGYNSVISDTFNGVSQVKMEISSLAGYLNQWRQGHCSEQRPKPSMPGPLQELQSRKEFIHTVSMEALMRVKEFLKLLLKNLDHLETC
ncbi:leptin a [Tautogolabrus adspersus]